MSHLMHRWMLPGRCSSATASSGGPFWLTFAGTSMLPTLSEPALLEVVPYRNRPILRGDVVVGARGATERLMVHRVVSICLEGLRTQGDNCQMPDPGVFPRDAVAGRAVAVWRGNRRRSVAGGWWGLSWHYLLRFRRIILPPLLRCCAPVYRSAVQRRWLVGIVPRRFRPAVIRFEEAGVPTYRILFSGRIVGWYDVGRARWIIKRPFRLLVDEAALLLPDSLAQ